MVEHLFFLILKSLYFFLPAYVANMSPVLFRWIPFGDQPINEKYLGGHKTRRGLIIGTVMGGVIFILQKYSYTQGFQQWALIDYSDFSIWFGFLLSFGALLGDAVKSYYKRKGGLKPGERWFPFDQIDFVIGGIIFSWFMYVPPIEVVSVLLILTPVLHVAINHLGYWVGIQKNKW